MSIATPHFLLFSESRRGPEHSRWRFVLEALDGTDKLEASDIESDTHGERLELLAVVRGLEALPQPSRVTLVTPSRYVDRGLTDGLPEWRSNNWQWEHFGEMAPVKNRDLWQRIDRALEYHQVECRLRRVDEPVPAKAEARPQLAGPNYLRRSRSLNPQPVDAVEQPGEQASALIAAALPPTATGCQISSEGHIQKRVMASQPNRAQAVRSCRRWTRRISLSKWAGELWSSLKVRMAQFGTGLLPPPWFD